MNKMSFNDKIDEMLLVSYSDKFDIKMWHNEAVEEEINERIKKQLNLLKVQLTAELDPKIRYDILHEEIFKCISDLRTEIRLFKSLTEKLLYSTKTKSSVDIHKTMDIPSYDRLWNSIRKWQRNTGTTTSELARMLGISERTLRDYDKSARTMTLEKLTNFLNYVNGSIELKF